MSTQSGQPNPDTLKLDIQQLYRDYDLTYFGGALAASGIVTVEWSCEQMTRCAGKCYSRRRSGRGIIVRLSGPLLRLRPPSDLKETLLHELIHAQLFLQSSSNTRKGHGPNFKRIMNEINQSTKPDPHRPEGGYHLTVRHSFTDEVKHYRAHHWECSKCKKLVSRPMNRAPSDADCRNYTVDGRKWLHDGTDAATNRCGLWGCRYHTHARKCGGQWVKVYPAKDEQRKPLEMDELPAPQTETPPLDDPNPLQAGKPENLVALPSSEEEDAPLPRIAPPRRLITILDDESDEDEGLPLSDDTTPPAKRPRTHDPRPDEEVPRLRLPRDAVLELEREQEAARRRLCSCEDQGWGRCLALLVDQVEVRCWTDAGKDKKQDKRSLVRVFAATEPLSSLAGWAATVPDCRGFQLSKREGWILTFA